MSKHPSDARAGDVVEYGATLFNDGGAKGKVLTNSGSKLEVRWDGGSISYVNINDNLLSLVPTMKSTRRIEIPEKNKVVDSPYTDEEAYKQLQYLVYPTNGERALSSNFAISLAGKQLKNLTEKQVKWIHVIVVEHEQKALAPKEEKTDLVIEIGSVNLILNMFAKAAVNLKYPKIRLQIGTVELRINVAGTKSKYSGSLMIYNQNEYENKGYGYGRVWYGRVSPDGFFHPNTKHKLDGLAELLKELASDPIATAKKYGAMTGNCCLCNKTLSQEKSTEVGYGKQCAKKWHWVWGGKQQ